MPLTPGPRALSVVATAVLIAAAALLLRMQALIAHDAVALAFQGAAVALMLWARWTFGMRSFHFAANPTAGGLVTWGPYRWMRHPIYAAVLLFVWAGVLGTGGLHRPAALALAGVATVATAIRIASEERLLRATFPEYAAYAGRTRRVVPYVL